MIPVIIEEIQKVHVRPYIVADGDDGVDDDAGPGAFPCDLAEEVPQRDRTVCDQRAGPVPNVVGELARGERSAALALDYLFGGRR